MDGSGVSHEGLQQLGTRRQLFAHVETAAHHGPGEERMEEWARLMFNGGWYAWSQGKYEMAKRMVCKAWRSRKKKLGKDDQKTLASTSLLG